jgi:hypothetical protein
MVISIRKLSLKTRPPESRPSSLKRAAQKKHTHNNTRHTALAINRPEVCSIHAGCAALAFNKKFEKELLN